MLVVTDGAPVLIRAIEGVFPRCLRQRCLARRIRNLEAKVTEELWREVKGFSHAAYRASSSALARLTRDEFVKRFEAELSSATRCFLDDFEACIARLGLPISHRRAIRTTNLLKRILGEERRRTNVIPHVFGERAVLKFTFAAMLCAMAACRDQRFRVATDRRTEKRDRRGIQARDDVNSNRIPSSRQAFHEAWVQMLQTKPQSSNIADSVRQISVAHQ